MDKQGSWWVAFPEGDELNRGVIKKLAYDNHFSTPALFMLHLVEQFMQAERSKDSTSQYARTHEKVKL